MRGITKPCARALVVTLPGLWCLWACTGDPFVTFYQELEHDAGGTDSARTDAKPDTVAAGPDASDAVGENNPIDVVWVDGIAEAGKTGLDGAASTDAGDGASLSCAIGTIVNQCGPSCPDGFSAVEYCWGTCGCGQEAMLKCVCIKG